MGGFSREREISFRSGKNIINSLRYQGFKNVSSIDPLKQEIPSDADAAFIALHGEKGEDGVIQALLEYKNIPYTGSGVLASALSMNKIASKRIFVSESIPTPEFQIIEDDLKLKIKLPVIIKPFSEGSSFGTFILKKKKDIKSKLRKAKREFKNIFAEEYIKGKEITIGILEKNKKTIVLPILELIPKKEFYDFEAKYTPGMTEFVLPARLPEKMYKKSQEIAEKSFLILGCRGLARVDMMICPKRGPFVTEINSIPGMTDTSDLPAEAKEYGISFDELVLIILESAFDK